MRTAVGILAGILGALATLAALVAFPAGVFLLAQVDRTRHADAYRPATFTVAWVAYQPGGRRTSADYWAVGTVNGHIERYYLRGLVSGVQGWDDLERQVSPGQPIKVLYDPSFTKLGDDRLLRVIAYEDDFPARQRARTIRTAALIYGPSLTLLAASVLLGWIVGRPPRISTGLTLFFLLGGLAGLVLIRVVQTASRAAAGGTVSPLDAGVARRIVTALPVEPILFVGTIVAVGLYLLRSRRKRREAMRRAASELGFEFVGAAPDARRTIEELGAFALLHRAVQRRFIENQMRGTRGEYALTVLDFGYTPESGKTRRWRTVVVIASPTLRLAPFLLEHRRLADPVSSAFGQRDRIELEPPLRVPDEYVLTGPSESAVRAAFGPPVLAFLQSHHRWHLESLGDRLLVHRGFEVRPSNLAAFVSDVMRLVLAFEGIAT